MSSIIVSFLLAILSTVTDAVRFSRGYYVRYYSAYYYYNYGYYDSSLSSGEIAGIVVGVLAAITMTTIFIICCAVWCAKSANRQRQQPGRVILSTTQTSASLSTAPPYTPPQPVTYTAASAPPPSYSDAMSQGNVNLGFDDYNKHNYEYVPPTSS